MTAFVNAIAAKDYALVNNSGFGFELGALFDIYVMNDIDFCGYPSVSLDYYRSTVAAM